MRLLNDRGIRYLVVGGFAVIAHGYVRTTKDLDIWIATDRENAEAIAEAVRAFFGIGPAAEVFMAHNTVFRAGLPPNRLEVFARILGVDFEACHARRAHTQLDGIDIALISLADLRAAKAASGRPQDLADLDQLPQSE